MFKRVEADIMEQEDEYKKDPLYKKAKKYYEKSVELQKKGDPKGSISPHNNSV